MEKRPMVYLERIEDKHCAQNGAQRKQEQGKRKRRPLLSGHRVSFQEGMSQEVAGRARSAISAAGAATMTGRKKR